MTRTPRIGLSILLACLTLSCVPCAAAPGRYDVVWDSPSKDYNGSMPLGNGEIGLNAWIESNGDLLFYISKTDSWDDNGRLVKVGLVRIHFNPAPPTAPFRQALVLRDAMMKTVYGTGQEAMTVQLWVDANRPVIQVAIDSARPITATAAIELWRTKPRPLASLECSDLMEDRSKPGRLHQPVSTEPDTLLKDQIDRIGWYHHNAKSIGPTTIAKIQGLSNLTQRDPLRGRTFGAVITADGGQRVDDTHLESPASKTHQLAIHVLTQHPATPTQWLESIDEAIATTNQQSFAKRREAHQRWWAEFWNRSWIHITTSSNAAEHSLLPVNNLPVRIGIDQSGGNRFSGRFGRLSILSTALTDLDIAALAQTPHDESISRDHLLYSGVPEAGDALPNSETWTFTQGMTIEAWLQSPNGGRIVDKITPGGANGFLLDTHPGAALRLIAGNQTVHRKDTLSTDRWTHVAATINNKTGQTKMFVNGKVVSTQDSEQIDDGLLVSRAYALQRYIDACAGRGRYPIKFNGSIFTVPYDGDPDYRRWGPGYWWQNTRLPYISMCAAGDFDMMRPLFRMYADELMPLHKYRTKLQTGADGAFIPECIYFWGPQFTATYGWTPIDQREDKLQQSGWHKWEWVSGPELVFMMLDYYEYTLDEAFLIDTLLPTAREILTFFDSHYKTNDAGQLVMHPAMACETWWDCTNPMPELAGLRATTARLLALPHNLTTPQQRVFWTSLRGKLAPLPTRKVGDQMALAPATRFAHKSNVENPELYAVFPFRLVSFEKDNVDLGIQALRHRWDRGNSGWRQDDVFMAYLGLADDARQNLIARARKKHTASRFPAFWGPNYDWVPDQDHGGILTKTPQAMLMQTDGKKIFLLPAWPRGWNATFKLHAPYRTVVEGEVRDGEIVHLNVTPPERRKDVVLPKSTP